MVAVRTERGDEFAAESALLAAGAAVPGLLAELGLAVPEASPAALLVATRPVTHDLTAVVNTPRVSLRPRPDGGLAVDADWASAQLTRTADGDYQSTPGMIEELLAEATRVLSGSSSLVAAWQGIGPKPVPGDGEPVLGRIDRDRGALRRLHP